MSTKEERKELSESLSEFISQFEQSEINIDFKGYWRLFLNKLRRAIYSTYSNPTKVCEEWLELTAFCQMMSMLSFYNCDNNDEALGELLKLINTIRQESGTFLKKKPKR